MVLVKGSAECGIGRVSVDNFASDDEDSLCEEDLAGSQAPYVARVVSRGRILAHLIVEVDRQAKLSTLCSWVCWC